MKVATKLSGLFSLMVLTSCFEPEQFPDVPNIEFLSLEFVDSSNSSDSLILKFNFEDGNGDLGLSANSFIPNYFLYVDSEKRVITADNIQDAVPPIQLAPIYFDNVSLISREGNLFTVGLNSQNYPAIIESDTFSNDIQDIVFECPNIINQNLALFDSATGVTLYEEVTIDSDRQIFTYDQVAVQDIDSEVPAIENDRFYNIITKFEKLVNDEIIEINFREAVGATDCSVGQFRGRIPIFDPEGRSGIITYNIISIFIDFGIGDDPFRVKFFVYDAAGNKSNEAVTPFVRLSEITRN